MIFDAGIFVIFLAIIIGFITRDLLGAFIGLILWIAAAILFFPLSFFQNKKNLKKHDELLKIIPLQYEKEKENYKAALKNHEKNFQIYLIECEKAEKQKINEEESFATYKINYDKYITQKNKVLKIRELLWHRARLCMRCGTAYMSHPK
jgi:energy-coupling factor transporter transmembrane protein EcfT